MKNLLTTGLLGLILTLQGCGDNGGGEKVGQIVRIRVDKSLGFCPTYEAELIRGGLNNGSGASGAIFDFTIEDRNLLNKVQAALDGQYEVKIKYNTEISTVCRSASSNNFLTSIEPLNAAGHPLQIAK